MPAQAAALFFARSAAVAVLSALALEADVCGLRDDARR
jgi:hypothetical protein